MRNAGSEIDSVCNSQSPISAVPIRIAPAMMLARTATLRRAGRGKSSVTARKVGTRPTGSTTTKQRQQRRNCIVERHDGIIRLRSAIVEQRD